MPSGRLCVKSLGHGTRPYQASSAASPQIGNAEISRLQFASLCSGSIAICPIRRAERKRVWLHKLTLGEISIRKHRRRASSRGVNARLFVIWAIRIAGLTASRISSWVQYYRGLKAHRRCAKSLNWRFAVETWASIYGTPSKKCRRRGVSMSR